MHLMCVVLCVTESGMSGAFSEFYLFPFARRISMDSVNTPPFSATNKFTESLKIRGQLHLKRRLLSSHREYATERERRERGNLSRRPFRNEHNLNVISEQHSAGTFARTRKW